MRYKMTLYKHEMKVNAKSLIIWTLSVGFICFGCILLYGGLEESVQDIAASFSDMGAMSAALGMDKMSLATLRGYFATEIAMMHGLGGAMFAAILGSGLLSKEESGHTVDFLNVFPIKRYSIVFWKYLSLVSNILLLNLVCSVLYILGFVIMGEEVIVEELLLYGFATSLMQIEIGSVCFLFSAIVKKVTISVGLGITILLFAADIMCRIVPALKKLKYITPFYYSNAADLFTDGKLNGVMAAIGMGVIFVSYIAALSVYKRKDL
ncbi:MAG: ABC transporter permease subunit [Lachnospiraceae bacterium]|nr:ABC transporter permease subunit [Lachnospiraceae bacterium]